MPQDAGLASGGPQPVQGWQPVTFHERGVSVPFTTPALLGARLRAGARGGLELVVPHVAGHGSVGILAWDRVGTLCSPTVFDRRLAARLAALPELTPAAVRAAACDEAAAGYAGLDAQEAAQAARRADVTERARAADALKAAVGDGGTVPPELAALLGPVGIDAAADQARLPRLLALMTALAEGGTERPRTGAEALAAETLAAAVCRVVPAAQAALLAARDLVRDVPALLRRWRTAQAAVAAALMRAEWLLDGWPLVCQVWGASASVSVSGAGGAAGRWTEPATLLPVLPREAGGTARPTPPPDPPAAERAARGGADWRSGVTMPDLVARNERLLAGILMWREEA